MSVEMKSTLKLAELGTEMSQMEIKTTLKKKQNELENLIEAMDRYHKRNLDVDRLRGKNELKYG